MSATKAQINWTAVSFNSTSHHPGHQRQRRPGRQADQVQGRYRHVPDHHRQRRQRAARIDHDRRRRDHDGFHARHDGDADRDARTTPRARPAAPSIFTLANAVFENADTQAQHAQFGSVTGTWQCYSSDGSTNPLSFTRS